MAPHRLSLTLYQTEVSLWAGSQLVALQAWMMRGISTGFFCKKRSRTYYSRNPLTRRCVKLPDNIGLTPFFILLILPTCIHELLLD